MNTKNSSNNNFYDDEIVKSFIIATMILSMLSAFIAVPVMAINPPGVYVDDTEAQTLENQPGIKIDKGDKIWVSGDGVTAGETRALAEPRARRTRGGSSQADVRH